MVEGTLIRLKVDHLPGERGAPPVWVWSSATDATTADVDFAWSCYLRRFDVEHTFRLYKQTLGWTRPRLREPEAADRWTWLVVVAHRQLRLADPIAADRHRRWEEPDHTDTLTPARVRRGLRNAPTWPAWPAFPNRLGRGPAGHRGRRTGTQPPATTWAKP
jgi:hypothetical protein